MALSVVWFIVGGMERVGFSSVGECGDELGAALSAVDRLICGEFWKMTGDELLDAGRRLEVLGRKVWAAQVRLVDELHQQGVAVSKSATSTAALVREAFSVSPGEAGSRVRAAAAGLPQDLPSGGETPPRLPGLAEVVDRGEVCGEHVRTVIATMHRLPASLPPQVRAAALNTLLGHATSTEPERFRKVARHLEVVLDPDGCLDEREPSTKMDFTIGSRNTSTGLTRIDGHLDDLGVAALRAVIDPLAAPHPGTGGVPDPRPAALRRAQALVDAAGFVLTHGSGTHGVLPEQGGQRPHVTVTLDWDVLHHTAGAAVLDSGTTLSVAQTRRLLCDAEVLPAVLGGAGVPLDLGRTARTFPPALRRAIALRDRGCAFPGCDRPPAWTDAHHVKWWVRDLGTTDLNNGVLLCTFHHTEIHRGEWEVRIAADGHPEFLPPPWIDPHRAPRRNTVHHHPPRFRQ